MSDHQQCVFMIYFPKGICCLIFERNRFLKFRHRYCIYTIKFSIFFFNVILGRIELPIWPDCDLWQYYENILMVFTLYASTSSITSVFNGFFFFFFSTVLDVREFRPSNILTAPIARGHSHSIRVHEVVRGINTQWSICQLILKKSIENSLLYHCFGSFQFPTWAKPALLDSLIYSIDWQRNEKAEWSKSEENRNIRFSCHSALLIMRFMPAIPSSPVRASFSVSPLMVTETTLND